MYKSPIQYRIPLKVNQSYLSEKTLLKRISKKPEKNFVNSNHIISSVNTFIGEAVQFDDVILLAVRRKS